MITFYPNTKTFKLDTSESSYIFKITGAGYLRHIWYGHFLREHELDRLTVRDGRDSSVPGSSDPDPWFSADTAAMEYPTFGAGDFRISALEVKNPAGNSVTDMRYVSHEIYAGKRPIPGMPSTFAGDDEADTLEILCRDVTGLLVTLYYTAYRNLPVISRRVSVKNGGEGDMYVKNIASMSVDFTHPEFDMLGLWGAWGRERRPERRRLIHGITELSSKRGASGHYHNPFAALLSPECTEEHGEAYGFSLVYSGNFAIKAELDSFGLTRILLGISPDGFEWKLEAGEEFYSPEALTVYSDNGVGGMSRAFHKLFRNHICGSVWQHKARPVIVNNWEATYFNFDDDKLVSIAKDAAALGIDMLVMDDGWFGKRNDDRRSLGDWYTNEEKLKGGLPSLVSRVNALGIKFGIWFEPEMISPDSDLYRAHPDWALHTEGRGMSISRSQYVLDLTRPEVCDYIVGFMTKTLSSANIEYVKWDFNRCLTEVASLSLPTDRQGEVFHRYVLGLYSVLDRVTSAFPNVLFEGCASGGGRYDPAMLAYFPQYWTSDDTDPIERISIQFGTSVVYPAATMSCHVSASPNHQTGRRSKLETRGNVAMAGVFGYELDLNRMTDDEKETVKRQVEKYKKISHIVTDGELYRLIPPTGDIAAWEYVTENKKEALFTFVAVNARIAPVYFVKLRGLDPELTYLDDFGNRFSGEALMYAGLNLTRGWRDGDSVTVHFTAEE